METKTKTDIVFILPNLLPGGAERVFSFIAQNIDKTQFNATLLIIGFSKDASYDVEGINLVFLEKSRVLNGTIPLFKFLLKHKPDIVLSAVGHLNTIMAYMSLFFPKTKFIAREVTVLSVDVDFFKTNSFDPWSLIIKKRFHFFDKIICQSQDMQDDIIKNYTIKPEKIVVINNPITDHFQLKPEPPSEGVVQFITVGRLSKEKGYERLLKILSKVEFPFHYTIIGNGNQKEAVLSLVDEYNLTDKITHIHFTKEVSKYLAKSDFFLQGSYYEGFPNCLIESCSVGTPVIAFDVPGGTKEIIEDGVNGYLVANEADFLEALNHSKSWNPEAVRKSVYSKFNRTKIIQQYETLFNDLINA